MTGDELERLLEKLDLDQKVRLLTGETVWRTREEPHIGLAAVVTSDGPVGVRGEAWDERSPSVVLPSPTALAATWDEPLVSRLAAVLARQARRKGVDVLLAPTLNLHRSPLAGRHFECFSEDPLLTGRIGAAYIRGLQSAGVAATAKHYVANDSETERMTLDARVSERALREVYMAPFEAAVAAGVWVVMAAYNRVNGTTMTHSPLLADPLKGAWGFSGPVVSDWGATRSTGESARAALDLVMPGPGGPWDEGLAGAVRGGRVAEEAVDDKVRRLLRLAARVGRLDIPGGASIRPRAEGPGRPSAPGSPGAPGAPGADGERALLRRAVAAGSVLLRNQDGLLPLEPGSLRRIAVLGPNAAQARIQGGGSAEAYPGGAVSPLEGLRAALAGRADVAYAAGARLTAEPPPLDGLRCRDPRSGEPGLLVRVLDAGGGELLAEHRTTGRLLEPPEPAGAAEVEIRALLRADAAGEWELGLAGLGRLRLWADGGPLIDTVVAPDTDDPTRIHVRPPFRTARLALAAGQEVELTARRRLDPGTGRAVVLAAGPPRRPEAEELAEAVRLAARSDAAVVVVGTTSEVESEGWDRTGLDLPGTQDALVEAVAAANPRTVVVVNSGSPVALPWRERVPALLLCWFPGQEAGAGLADVLLGRSEPGGRLPTTWADRPRAQVVPRDGLLEYSEGLHLGYRGWLREAAAGAEAGAGPSGGAAPAYWFGHGLGYTTWSHEELAAPARLAAGEDCPVRVAVRNSGRRAGREVVQLYLSRPDSAVERPERWLAGYAAVRAEPGERSRATIQIPARAFQHWCPDAGGWRTEPGRFILSMGRSAGELPLRTAVFVAESETSGVPRP